ncbi:MAG: type II toxin-antitoxin system VapC family toxin [Nitrospinae bacterium]|nr:type II toxin-antitoxin system VapC family toxin [Nitrospinota bacterium]
MNGLILDTHALLWWLFGDERLSKKAHGAIADPDHVIWVSAASAWEISTKARLGKLPEAGDVPQKLSYYLRQARFLELGVTVEHGVAAGALPGPHRDPFDRMLIAQSIITNCPVVTSDPMFREYGAKVIW